MPHSRLDELFELLPHGRPGRLEQRLPRHHNDLETGWQVEATEHLAKPPLGQIPLDRAADLLAGGDAEPGRALAHGLHTHTHELAVALDAPIEHPGELAPPAQPCALRKRLGHWGRELRPRPTP